jgi:hypothetical protein
MKKQSGIVSLLKIAGNHALQNAFVLSTSITTTTTTTPREGV